MNFSNRPFLPPKLPRPTGLRFGLLAVAVLVVSAIMGVAVFRPFGAESVAVSKGGIDPASSSAVGPLETESQRNAKSSEALSVDSVGAESDTASYKADAAGPAPHGAGDSPLTADASPANDEVVAGAAAVVVSDVSSETPTTAKTSTTPVAESTTTTTMLATSTSTSAERSTSSAPDVSVDKEATALLDLRLRVSDTDRSAAVIAEWADLGFGTNYELTTELEGQVLSPSTPTTNTIFASDLNGRHGAVCVTLNASDRSGNPIQETRDCIHVAQRAPIASIPDDLAAAHRRLINEYTLGPCRQPAEERIAFIEANFAPGESKDFDLANLSVDGDCDWDRWLYSDSIGKVEATGPDRFRLSTYQGDGFYCSYDYVKMSGRWLFELASCRRG